MSNFLPNRRAARLAQNHHFMSQPGKSLRQAFDLRGFPAPFGSFERDEYPHGPSLKQSRAARYLFGLGGVAGLGGSRGKFPGSSTNAAGDCTGELTGPGAEAVIV